MTLPIDRIIVIFFIGCSFPDQDLSPSYTMTKKEGDHKKIIF
jgi:hypothetical protein